MSLTDTAIRNTNPKDQPHKLIDKKDLHLLVCWRRRTESSKYVVNYSGTR